MDQLAATVARLRVCQAAGIAAEPELVSQALACLEDLRTATTLRVKRDEMIRRAAVLLGSGGVWAHAGTLKSDADRMLRNWSALRTREPDPPFTVRACLHAAALHAELPSSQRQYYRILAPVD